MSSKRACQGKLWLSQFKINGMLKSLYRKNRYLISYLKQLLCNALIQPHFNYVCSAWYRNLNKTFKSKYKLSKTEVLDTVSSYIKEVTLEWDTLKNLTAFRFLKDLISTFVLTLLNFLRKLVLWSISSKSENFCFETKTSFKKHVFWSKKFVVSNTNSFEPFADGPGVDQFT